MITTTLPNHPQELSSALLFARKLLQAFLCNTISCSGKRCAIFHSHSALLPRQQGEFLWGL